jgi:hypothetical protein
MVGVIRLASGALRVLAVVAIVVLAGASVLVRAQRGLKAGAMPSSTSSLNGSPASSRTSPERRRVRLLGVP